MGLRKDLDSVQKRWVYYLIDLQEIVLYVGTTANPKSRLKEHQKAALTQNSAFYKYVRDNDIIFTMKVVVEITSTYAESEKIEIAHIIKHQATTLNFYNNPNKERLKKLDPTLEIKINGKLYLGEVAPETKPQPKTTKKTKTKILPF